MFKSQRLGSDVGDILTYPTAAEASAGMEFFQGEGHIVFRMGPFDFACYDLWNCDGADWPAETIERMKRGAL